jgi:beta-galactosidase
MRRNHLSRRQFLQTSAATAVAASLTPAHAQSGGHPTRRHPEPYPEVGVLIPDEGWHLWIDQQAQWKDDTIFLPEDVRPGGPGDLATLPVNPPTGGWKMLTPKAGKPVVLPTTVEQHFWGKFGSRPYTPDEYRYAADDPIPQNGAYLGVSWWYRNIEIPLSMRGKRLFLHIRGARLRAEVYLNQKLVGYSIMEELPFECDITAAAHPGGINHLAIRITNPFGRYDWVDGLNAQWGAVNLYRSHGFGGLDRGITLSAHSPAGRIADAWVLNTSAGTTIQAFAKVELPHPGENAPPIIAEEWRSRASVEVIDPTTGKLLPSVTAFTQISIEGSTLQYMFVVEGSTAKLWDLDTPKLYHLHIKFGDHPTPIDTRTIPFGFRWFAPSGLGPASGNQAALFRLNGRRIKIYTAISWGFWGLNGLFPTPELAEKEVAQAKKLNLNCLNFHRNVGKEDVFRAHDRLGLLRYMEPGGGKLAIGAPAPTPSGEGAIANPGVALAKPSTPADKFAQRFMITKCIAMVKAFRSHPSLIEYCVQNEIGADLKNPDTIAILQAMRAEDPSRCIVLNDGFVAPPRKAAQAWFEPYNFKLHRSDIEPWGGWWNQHQGAGDQWYDEFYKDPENFTYRSPVRNQISEFGEMEGCATPDNHSLMVHQITQTFIKYGGDSYDLTDHKQILAAYDKFLDKWNFRKSFPATERLWLSLGSKCYDTWQNYLENARIGDDLDFAAISGWETTAIENHSGIVDNLRNFKSDPAPISGALQPVRPVAKQRSLCIALGESAIFDLYLLNDTPEASTGTLTFTAVSPSGKLLKLGTFPVPDETRDQFSYLLQEEFTTPPLTEEGMYRFKFALSSAPLSTQIKDIWVANTKLALNQPLTIAVSGITPALHKQLSALPGVTVEDFVPGKKYAAIVSSGLTAHTSADQKSGDTTGLEAQPASVVGAVQTTTQLGHFTDGILTAVRAGTPLLAIPQADTLSEGVARELAAAEAFTYNGTVGDFRAPWMGNWYFVRKHPIYAGLPVDQVMGIHYQARGRQSNGLLVDKHPQGAPLEIVAAYSRDHDRNIGAGTFTTRLGTGKLLYQRVPELHPVLQQRFLANALTWLTS